MTTENLFEAKADSLSDTMGTYAGKVGFKVPEYQRTYDWKTENIKRLLEDCLNGFDNCWESESSYTFLGTIILVKKQRSQERTFDGTSLEVVDGQQRLTTLSLLCCILIEMLITHQNDSQALKEPTKQWIDEEIDFQLQTLFECVIGLLPERRNNFPFPRIVRSEDNRASNIRSAEYRSVVARFFMEFADFYQRTNLSPFEPSREDRSSEGKRLFENFDYIKEQISFALDKVDQGEKQFELEFERTGRDRFDRRPIRRLFEKLHSMGESQEHKAVAEVSEKKCVAALIRLITFSSYLTKCVILTRVETEEDSYAFDIFDALNTTGEPLTAIETLRPRIIQFERTKEGFEGSESERYLENLKEHLDEAFEQTEKRQIATKELLVSFALYLDGYKLGMQLNAQRAYLRSRFEGFSNDETGSERRKFVKSISDVAEFRFRYWELDQIRSLDTNHSTKVSDTLKTCFAFIRRINTSLALPVLARYWEQWRQDEAQEVSFVESVKAITAFIVLRRAATGSTAGIDSDFRRLMNDSPKIGGDPLCAGIKQSNLLIEPEELKKELVDRYLKRLRGDFSREAWIDMASEVPLARSSQPLCRFLLMAASHNAMPDANHQGLLTREGVRPSEDLHYLNFRTWDSELYATVEHVAPDSDSKGNWDAEIYRDVNTRHSIGNLILLPQRENSTIGNESWKKKKLFYSALTAKTENEKEKALKEARDQGLSFGKKTERLLEKGQRLRMLEPVTTVKTWDRQFIKDRGRRTLGLAWDKIWSWVAPS